MPAWIRRTAFALAALILALTAGALWLASGFDPQRYRSAAVDWMSANRDRTLEVNGPVSLEVFPRLKVRLASVSLSEVGRPYSAITLDEAALFVQLLPLLRGTLVVDRIEAQGVRLHWLRDAKGAGNFDDLWQPNAPATPASTALRFDVQHIALADVQMRIKDQAAGIDGVLDLKELSTGRIADRVESRIDLVAQFGFKTPALKGELSGSTRFTPDLENRALRLARMNLAYKGDAPGASSVDATLGGALAWNSRNGALDARALNIRMTANAAGIKFVGSALTMDRFALDATNKAISVGKLKLRLQGTQAGKPLELLLDWPELDVTGNVLKGSALSGRLSLGGALPLQASFSSGAPVGSFDELRVPDFVAQANGSAARHAIDATLRSELVLQPEQRAVLLEKSGLRLHLDAPGLRPLRLTMNGSGNASVGSAGWKVTGQLNGNGFRSEGSASFSGITPYLKAQGQFDTLDIDSLLAPAAATSAGAGSHLPIDLAALRMVDGSFAIRIGNLVSRKYRVGDARLSATLEAGMLRVTSLRANAWGGQVAGSAFADARASRLALRASATGVDINELLKDVADKEVLQGKASVAIDIDTAGRTLGELVARLKGSAEMDLHGGAITGFNLALALQQAATALPLRQDAAVRASKAEKTDFSELQATFHINEGVARSTDLQLRSPLLRLGGEGALDLAKGRVDYAARTTLIGTGKGQEASALSALRGLTVPVALNGPFDAIVWKIQWSSVPVGTAQQQAESKMRSRQAPKGGAPGSPSPEDGMKNKHRGPTK